MQWKYATFGLAVHLTTSKTDIYICQLCVWCTISFTSFSYSLFVPEPNPSAAFCAEAYNCLPHGVCIKLKALATHNSLAVGYSRSMLPAAHCNEACLLQADDAAVKM